MPIDKRALKILNDTYWSASGWRRDAMIAPSDFAYAKSQGLMFEPILLTHDQANAAATTAIRQTSPEAVSHAFVASLSSRRLDLRSALGSFAVGRHLVNHHKTEFGPSPICTYCGEYDTGVDPNILNFERFKWGGVRHDKPSYIALDLQCFLREESSTPTPHDYDILRSIIHAAKSIGPTYRLADLDKAIAKMLPSNSNERRSLIGILGYAGILIDRSRPSFLSRFVPCSEREQTPWSKDDWPYPVQWWNGSHGVNDTALFEWFPQF